MYYLPERFRGPFLKFSDKMSKGKGVWKLYSKRIEGKWFTDLATFKCFWNSDFGLLDWLDLAFWTLDWILTILRCAPVESRTTQARFFSQEIFADLHSFPYLLLSTQPWVNCYSQLAAVSVSLKPETGQHPFYLFPKQFPSCNIFIFGIAMLGALQERFDSVRLALLD